ncbi:MAG TPA: AI-2E family transporter [Saprospiraceae bacterium]|jgi:predicted PurR-regulated permease PerM|nr:AI-2E family transporter [Saprospiraceae bacterium]MCC6687655.1 AI-2E family transporter [Saprospiraceae bacterium]HMW74713.1 AI-2E family transporter [Saprospiraceae bacterium]HMX82511.1 AI-2E family transporter [Saprospiraceae bacterium]HMX84538.1 AI-2E family transporter [Saprospiraceae bacterium]
MNASLVKINQTLLFIILTGLILYFGKPLLMPLSFSLLIACVLYPFSKWLELHRFPKVLAITISLSMLGVLLVIIGALFVRIIAAFTLKWPLLEKKLLTLINTISEFFISDLQISFVQQELWLSNALDKLPEFILPILKNVLYESSVGLVLIILIPIFSGLILYYRRRLVNSLFSLFPTVGEEIITQIIRKTIDTYYNFIKGMLLVYLIVGALNSVGLLIIGIPDAFVYGFLVAIMTFIPYIGIIIAAALPVSVAWITFENPVYPFMVILLFTIVQYLEANVIFPFAVSSKLNVNALATLAMILLGGMFWGGSGMILFVPFAAIIKIVADNLKANNVISILFGEDKKLDR